MTQYRKCDKCGKEIKGDFIKCYKSHYEKGKNQELKHVGDLCLSCWKKVFR